jgi:exodeoxyribonuclease VII small subunit
MPKTMSKTMPKTTKKLDFENALEELDSLVSSLEEGKLSLEASLCAFERGIKLTRECQQHLANAEQTISLLVGEGDNLTLTDADTLININLDQ